MIGTKLHIEVSLNCKPDLSDFAAKHGFAKPLSLTCIHREWFKIVIRAGDFEI